MKEIDKIYESLLFSIPKNNLGMEYKYGFQQGIALFKKAIDNSTVSSGQMRKKGRWIANGDIHKECPFCGEDWDKYVFGDVWYTGELPKFCPNCGEDMRGE